MAWAFSRRSNQPELMDSQTVSFEEFKQCLSELEEINHWTLAYRPTLHWLCSKLTQIPQNHTVSILDIGSGGGDMLRRIWKKFKRNNNLDLQGVDLNPWSKISALEVTAPDVPVHFETSDIFKFTPERCADFIISSLFTHHLSDVEIINFLQWMEKHAERGWFINDLHRHPIAYYFIKYAVRLLGYNRLVRHDAPVSVMRSFTLRDWKYLLSSANVPMNSVVIRWYFPFRYCLARNKL